MAPVSGHSVIFAGTAGAPRVSRCASNPPFSKVRSRSACTHALDCAKSIAQSARRLIYTGGRSVAEMRAALRRGVCIVGLIDVPPGRARSAKAVQFLGDRAWFPTGLLRLARIANVPVAVYTLGCDRATGKRKLHIRRLPPPAPDASEWANDEERLRMIVRELEQAIAADPPAGHAWADLSLFRQAPAVRATRGGEGGSGGSRRARPRDDLRPPSL
jgi:hypothetical protein